MDRTKDVSVGDLNWAEYEGSLPCQGVVHPRGVARERLRARMRAAFDRARINQAV